MFLLAWNLLRGRVGRALVAIRDNPIAAEAMGVNTALYKSLDLRRQRRSTPASPARSARIAVAVRRARQLQRLPVDHASWSASWSAGSRRSPGAIFGALFIQFVPNIADEISKAAPWAIYGVFLIGFMYVMPTGVAGGIRTASGRGCAPAGAGSSPATPLHRCAHST